MQDEQRSQYRNRGRILKLLSDEEIARVSNSDTAAALAEGDEYLDLGDLERGVRRARGTAMSMRRVLPRNAVHADTWSDILVQLVLLQEAAPDSEREAEAALDPFVSASTGEQRFVPAEDRERHFSMANSAVPGDRLEAASFRESAE